MSELQNEFDLLALRAQAASSPAALRELAQQASEAARQEFHQALPVDADPITTLRAHALYASRVLQLFQILPTFAANCAAPARFLWKLARQMKVSNKLPLEPAFISNTDAAQRDANNRCCGRRRQ